MSYMKSVRKGSLGNRALLKSYGGSPGAQRESYPKGYATGGVVRRASGGSVMNEGLEAAGEPAKPNLARSGRKMKKGGKDKDGKKGTTVNVVIASGGDKGPAMPPPGPPMPPPGAGGPLPPPMMRARGGKVVHMDAGAGSGEGRLEKKAKYGV